VLYLGPNFEQEHVFITDK